jgi:hypothetical protein
MRDTSRIWLTPNEFFVTGSPSRLRERPVARPPPSVTPTGVRERRPLDLRPGDPVWPARTRASF